MLKKIRSRILVVACIGLSCLMSSALIEHNGRVDIDGDGVNDFTTDHRHLQVRVGCVSDVSSVQGSVSLAGFGIGAGFSFTSSSCWLAPQVDGIMHYHGLQNKDVATARRGKLSCDSNEKYRGNGEITDTRRWTTKTVFEGSGNWAPPREKQVDVIVGKLTVKFTGGGCFPLD